MENPAWTNLTVNGESARVRFADAAACSSLVKHVETLCRPDLHAGPDLVRVKTGNSRTLWRCRLDGQTYYLKHYHSRSLAHRLAGRIRGDDADRELRFSRLLRAGGVPTVEVLALGHVGSKSWLLTREVAQATPADAWHEEQVDPRRGESLAAQAAAIRRVLAAVAEAVARMHAAGVSHRDLHAANILLAERDGRLEPVLMDLHRMSWRRRLSRRACAKDLALLMHDRRHLTTRTQRMAFLKRYLQVSGRSGTLRGWAIQVDHFAEAHRRRLYAARDRRTLGDNRYFARLRLPDGWRGHAVLASKRRSRMMPASRLTFSAEDWRAALADPAKLFESADAVVVNDSAGALVVRRSLSVGEHVLDVHIKRARRRRPHESLFDLVRPSRAVRVFRLGHALLARRIPTAMPLAALEQRRGLHPPDCILITETVRPALSLHRFLERWLGQPTAGRQPISIPRQRQLAQDLLGQMGRLLRQLYGEGFAHRDLKADNLLVHATLDDPPRIVLIDLDGLTRRWRLSRRRMFQGLMRLNVSLLKCPAVNHAGRLRMLLGYLRRPGSGRIHFKPYWRELERWSTRELAQQIADRQRRQKQVRR